jgi:predicted O-methyltransferase YrrM
MAMFPELRLRRLVGKSIAIRTQTTVCERLALYEMARASLSTNVFVEIGSYLGATAVVLAAAIQKSGRGKVYCIDTWQNDAMSEGKWDTFGVFQKNIQRWDEIVVPVVGRSDHVDLPIKNDVDLVFIDGDHTYPAVKHDIEKYACLVREGGFLALHDQSFYPSVTKAMGEVLDGGGWFVYCCVDNIIFLQRDSNWRADPLSEVAWSPLKDKLSNEN